MLITADPHTAYRADRDFLKVEVEARVVAFAMSVLGFQSNSDYKNSSLPSDIGSLTKPEKRKLLLDISAKVVDAFIFDKDKASSMVATVLLEQEQENLAQQELNEDGPLSMQVSRIADGSESTKYALECLYQFFLVHALLTSRDIERFVWNRSVNNHNKYGTNIPLDLDVEHSYNFLKQCIKNLGPNVRKGAVLRICKAETNTHTVLDNMDCSLELKNSSTRHGKSSTADDIDSLVKRLQEYDVFTYKKDGRSYNHYSDFERNRKSAQRAYLEAEHAIANAVSKVYDDVLLEENEQYRGYDDQDAVEEERPDLSAPCDKKTFALNAEQIFKPPAFLSAIIRNTTRTELESKK
ncbi:hypothetical protein AC249_AIPGENE2550 [Exaiptasia diaphana]|nr:hypothetical protein AC249_AIPGENE2550 [Exaiptasia diaphana]